MGYSTKQHCLHKARSPLNVLQPAQLFAGHSLEVLDLEAIIATDDANVVDFQAALGSGQVFSFRSHTNSTKEISTDPIVPNRLRRPGLCVPPNKSMKII